VLLYTPCLLNGLRVLDPQKFVNTSCLWPNEFNLNSSQLEPQASSDSIFAVRRSTENVAYSYTDESFAACVLLPSAADSFEDYPP